uniref:tRNA-uridine aminocarboxypropyltransferase n=1 Tax=Trypanosoma congolense (strain IL3000) TaxID=1068625 RepID=G0UKF1_TRYCI|nr:conserved hypothetical protein [Trypanosoma congolense IL3000]
MINFYKESVRRLMEYVGLHGYGTPGVSVSPPTSGTAALYFHETETPEWKEFITSLPSGERHNASVRRRLSTHLWSAVKGDICLWCWFSKGLCFCDRLEEYRQRLLEAQRGTPPEITVVMHPEEIMRGTNSGHIIAFILGAPLRIWGVAEDDSYLNTLQAVDLVGNGYSASGETPLHTASLYPESGAPLLEDFVKGIDSAHKIHLLLLDATWSQANALNRHIPRHIPRVGLRIDESYSSLFKALRKQTRQSGVSTFEATSMALQQCCNSQHIGGNAGAVVHNILTSAMKEFVDLKCLVNHRSACFLEGPHTVTDIIERRKTSHRDAALDRLRQLNEKAASDEVTRGLLLPPMLNYCYACDVLVGWPRMVEHVMGRGHAEALKKNPLCTPSVSSRRLAGRQNRWTKVTAKG